LWATACASKKRAAGAIGGDARIGGKRCEEQENKLPVGGGDLDPSRIAREQNALQRYRLAREIYTLLTSQAATTSMRFGLFGEWGDGKTTIANWVEEIAERDGHMVVWFNPWTCPSLDEM
jgi:hypothetical protein